MAAAYGVSGIVLRLPAIIWWVGKSGPVSTRDILTLATPYAVSGAAAVAGWQAFAKDVALTPIPFLVSSAMLTFAVFLATIALFRSGREALGEVLALMPRGPGQAGAR